jgi:hypothetical protein
MRGILTLTILLGGLSSAAPEPEYPSLIGGYFQTTDDDAPRSLVEIESPTRRTDRLTVATLQAGESAQQAPDLNLATPMLPPAFVSPGIAPERTPELSLDDLCNALLTSAEDNDLPVAFFANLIWQESRLRDDAVSPVGALGIAQFMPRVAVASGLDDPLDPLQAIPASARLLHGLRAHFGNLGYAAAAYNAGAHRVSEWLERGRSLPRETLNYVLRVTGRSAEAWRKTPPDNAVLTFVQRLPCRALPAFADVEQARLQQVQVKQPEAEPAKVEQQSAKPAHGLRRPAADRRSARLHAGKRHAMHLQYAAHKASKPAPAKRSVEVGTQRIATHHTARRQA